MTNSSQLSGLQLRSLVKATGELELSLIAVATPQPGPDEVVVRIDATPINPSDIGLLFGAADLGSAKASRTESGPVVTMRIPERAMGGMAARVGQSMVVGNEGAGVVVATGESAAAKALLGKTVAVLGGAMYAQFRTIKAVQCLVLPEGATASDGASCFVNPLTALGMVETMRRECHKALVHTAAASNLGQMLNKICIKDQIGLVNIVRKPEQAAMLRGLGARYVCDTSASSFMVDLTQALVETGATIAFDATGGGKLGGANPDLHGSSAQSRGHRIQPIRFHHAQAGLHLRRVGYGPDRVRAQLWLCMEHGRMAALSILAAAGRACGAGAEAARGSGIDDHFCQFLFQRNFPGRSPASGRHCHVRSARHGNEVPDQPSQDLNLPGSTTNQRHPLI